LALEDANGAVDHFMIGAGILESESLNVSLPVCDNTTSSTWVFHQCVIDADVSGRVCLRSTPTASVSYGTLFQSDYLLALHASSQSAEAPSHAFRSMKALSLSRSQTRRDSPCVCSVDEVIPARAAAVSMASLPNVAKAWLEAASGCWIAAALRVQQEATMLLNAWNDAPFGTQERSVCLKLFSVAVKRSWLLFAGHAPDVLSRLTSVLDHYETCSQGDGQLPVWKAETEIARESKPSWLATFQCQLGSLRVANGDFSLAAETMQELTSLGGDASVCSCVSTYPAVWEVVHGLSGEFDCRRGRGVVNPL
jgi:hypothetical protein